MLWSGMSPDDLDKIGYDDARNAWELYQRGMAGPSVHYITAYNNYAMLHRLGEISISAASNGKYKSQEPEKFEKIFTEQFNLLTLKDTVQRNQLSLGTQAVLAIEGAPEWLRKAAQEEISNGSTRSHGNNSRPQGA